MGQGTSDTTSITAAATTTNANDLLIGANLVGNITTGAGALFTSRIITDPDSDILEERIVTTTGSYTASAAISSGTWIMQMVAFRAQGSAPDLTLTKTHAGAFSQGQTGATYTLTASNAAGAVSTSGTVTVVDTLPTGLTPTALSGTGWTCTLASVSCTRSDVLAGGTSYPAITLTVSVSATAPASVTNTGTVSGGGDITSGNNTATDPTTIIPVPANLTIHEDARRQLHPKARPAPPTRRRHQTAQAAPDERRRHRSRHAADRSHRDRAERHRLDVLWRRSPAPAVTCSPRAPAIQRLR